MRHTDNKTRQVAEFNAIKMDIIKQQDDFYLTAEQIGKASKNTSAKDVLNNIAYAIL